MGLARINVAFQEGLASRSDRLYQHEICHLVDVATLVARLESDLLAVVPGWEASDTPMIARPYGMYPTRSWVFDTATTPQDSLVD